MLSAGRTALATTVFGAPVASVRLLGVDTATARRVCWLTRMLAVRDGALGIGGLVSARRGGAAPWLVGGAVADAVDAVVLASALRQRRVTGAVATGVVPGAAAAAVAGALTAWAAHRR